MSRPESDAAIARRVAERAPDAASCEAELCARFLNRARLYGLKHLRFDVTAAEDLAQQVMMILLEALRAGRVEDLERVDRFMLGTCRNVARSMRRGEARLEGTRRRLSTELAGAATPPWDLVESRRVEKCLAALPPRESRLLFLLFQEGATASEAAEKLGTTPGNIRVMHHRAIARLRDCVGT
ncbi:MAG TPA: sigma-70 family RNA polymerase sigma factor [Vicinamibacteria bacterium]|nr:sigma-70 family RNA polymerase sigma factor [Vicinamibacteria bacterium]